MNTPTKTRPRFRVPTVSVDAEVSLDEFDLDDIRKYLRHQGDAVAAAHDDDAASGNSAGGMFIDPEDLGRIETLALCGQRECARQFALQIKGFGANNGTIPGLSAAADRLLTVGHGGAYSKAAPKPWALHLERSPAPKRAKAVQP